VLTVNIRLVLHSQGRPRIIRADGCSFITRRERDWVEWSANETEIFTDSWINPQSQVFHQRGTV